MLIAALLKASQAISSVDGLDATAAVQSLPRMLIAALPKASHLRWSAAGLAATAAVQGLPAVMHVCQWYRMDG